MSNANVPVTVFNTSTIPLQLIVNNGTPVSIPGTSPNQNWIPQQPNSNPFSFSQNNPAPNALGYGSNMVQVMVNEMPINVPLQVSIPMTQLFSLQLYIFLANSSASYALLNNGQLIGQGQG